MNSALMAALSAKGSDKSGLKTVATNDKSAPKLNGCISELDTHAYNARVLDANIEEWYEPLESVTFATEFVPITQEAARAIMAAHVRYERHVQAADAIMSTQASTGSVGDAAAALLKSLVAELSAGPLAKATLLLDAAIARVSAKHSNGDKSNDDAVDAAAEHHCFVKSSSRSPKDSAVVLGGFDARAVAEWKAKGLGVAQADERLRVLVQLATDVLRVLSAADVLALFVASQRIHDDFDLALGDEVAAMNRVWCENFVVREWVPLDVGREFRGFCTDGRLTALSQYNHLTVYPLLLTHACAMADAIHAFHEMHVQPALKKLDPVRFKNLVVDYAIVPSLLTNDACVIDRIVLIEVNPFQPTTDGALFSWATDAALLENGPAMPGDGCAGGEFLDLPFAFRVRDKPLGNIHLACLTKWRALLQLPVSD
jgi:hypothetical protein